MSLKRVADEVRGKTLPHKLTKKAPRAAYRISSADGYVIKVGNRDQGPSKKK